MSSKSTVVRMKDVPGVTSPFQTVVRMLLHPEITGTPQSASVLMVTLPPGTSTSLHNHVDSDEWEYVVSGSGVLEAGDKKDIPVEAFSMVLNPKGIMHEVKNTSAETMYLLRLHIPALKPSQPGDLIDKAIQEAKKAAKKSA